MLLFYTFFWHCSLCVLIVGRIEMLQYVYIRTALAVNSERLNLFGFKVLQSK